MAETQVQQLPMDASTVRLMIQAMKMLNDRMDNLESSQAELTTRFNTWNSSYKQFLSTVESYMTAQAKKEAQEKVQPAKTGKSAS